MTTATDRAAELIASLADRYGWDVTDTDALQLRAALRGHTPTTAEAIADQTQPATAAEFAAALQADNRGEPAPTPTAVDPGRRDVPYHLPSCNCEGVGELRIQVMNDTKPTTALTRCPGNRGRPITADQYDQWVANTDRTHRANGTDPRAAGRALIAQARAQLPDRPEPTEEAA
ncbi:MAG: hypothetical protein AAF547_06510 [Actinomycetota bacterium]